MFRWGYVASTGPLAISVGTYSVIGAASFLSGVMRMTISLTIIMIEATRQISYGIPILIAVSVRGNGLYYFVMLMMHIFICQATL